MQITATVERATKRGAPTAFLIWAEGNVETSKGTFAFTEAAALSIIAQHIRQGTKIPFDVDHLSLDDEAPLSMRGAIGWHSLELRRGNAGVELWAVECEWIPEIVAGFNSEPPRWKYFSPTFTLNPETQAITGYVNCALTNLPATYGIHSIAANRKETTMTTKKTMTNTESASALRKLAANTPDSLTSNAMIATAESLENAADPKLAATRASLDRKMGISGASLMVQNGARHGMRACTPSEARAELARRAAGGAR